jgi:2-hydroxy-3-keto-5-methylthiopentenyl-1-phosphate phosphatase
MMMADMRTLLFMVDHPFLGGIPAIRIYPLSSIVYTRYISDSSMVAVLADFDNTVTRMDASYAILNGFATGDWRRIETETYAGRYSIIEALTLQAGMVRGAPQAMDSLVRDSVLLRDGFKEFACECRKKGMHLEICSDGFGHTIPIVLEREGLEWIPWTSNRTWYEDGGLGIAFDHHRENCPINGNCKCDHYFRLKERFGTVVYVGDGGTDACVAERAEVLFARDWLAEYCSKERIKYIPWDSWSDVWEKMRSLLGPMGAERLPLPGVEE